MVAHFTDTILDAIDATSTEIKSTPSNRLDLPHWLRTKIKDRNKARKKWQASRSLQDKTKYNTLVHEVRLNLQEFRNKKWEMTLDDIELN